MVVCVFEHKGIVQYAFIAQGQKVNQQCYLEVLTKLREGQFPLRMMSKTSRVPG